MARCAVPDRVQQSERMVARARIARALAPLNAARTAQRAVPTILPPAPAFAFHSLPRPVSSAGLNGSAVAARCTRADAGQTMDFVDLKAQYRRYQGEIDLRMRQVLEHGQFIQGPEIAELEKILADYVGVAHCISVASGTASLEIALRALEIGPGDEVITVPFTWISSAEVIALVGAKPVFVDIDPVTFNIDPDRLEAAISPRTKALIPVSLFGQMPDYDRINAVARTRGIPVIEDAAQSFGARQNGKLSCGVTDIASTSFFPAKPFGCYGDGGALFTQNAALAERMRAIRTHGGLKRHHHPWVGTNGRFDTLQAAVLLAKWPHFEWELAQRDQLGARYSQHLRDICVVPAVRPGNTHAYAQYTIRLPDRNRAGELLKARGIPTAVYYPKCLHEQPVFAKLGYQLGDFPESEKAAREVLSLPFHPFLTEKDQDYVVAGLKAILQ
jgi:UDP-2-acetamido-2-deoxy-ribo-hexuluronate aminotransferase